MTLKCNHQIVVAILCPSPTHTAVSQPRLGHKSDRWRSRRDFNPVSVSPAWYRFAHQSTWIQFAGALVRAHMRQAERGLRVQPPKAIYLGRSWNPNGLTLSSQCDGVFLDSSMGLSFSGPNSSTKSIKVRYVKEVGSHLTINLS